MIKTRLFTMDNGKKTKKMVKGFIPFLAETLMTVSGKKTKKTVKGRLT